ncbi:hypothetical protein PGB34_23015 [Xenophilus arseniciresistens]|uniref:Uncharacterized protein n=1 Tax=Xenophilus arseniciresistens TaxID=1283306 RepID=A0AAE3T2N7_9BURK|nr:hypothetical protein [Xenophilus arseniciresistens]MDA7419256.1 hypothetical protein [Xenophilus arseniciresistens]
MKRRSDCAMLIYFLFLFLIIYGIGLPLLLLVGVPLIQWIIHGVLDFSLKGSGFLGLLLLIVGMTLVSAAAMWVEGKIHKRW